MAKNKKKVSKDTGEKITIGVIIVSVLICCVCFFSDFKVGKLVGLVVTDFFGTTSNVDELVSDVGTIINASNWTDYTSEFNSEFGDEITSIQSAIGGGDTTSKPESDTSPDNVFGVGTSGSQNANRVVGTVVRVKDGDTYVVNLDGVDTTIRLIGVDTPESVAPSTYSKENTEEGKTVSDIVKVKIKKGDRVFVEYDAAKTDKYNRTLAYLYFEDGTMIQEWLLNNGYAQVMTIQPNSKYAKHFAELQHKAAENKVGLWNGFFEEKE